MIADPIAVEWCDVVDSTNERLLRRAWTRTEAPNCSPAPATSAGSQASHVAALAARKQLAGRGRRQRVWYGEPGMSLLMSVSIDRPGKGWPAALSGFSIACASAVIDALEAAPVAGQKVEAIGIKWPNDLVRLREGLLQPATQGTLPGPSSWRPRRGIWLEKIGGLLIETRQSARQRRIVIGLGLNLCRPQHAIGAEQHPQEDPQSSRVGAEPGEAWAPTLPGGLLDDAFRARVDHEVLRELADRLAQRLPQAWCVYENEGLAAFRDAIAQRNVLRGRWVDLEDAPPVGARQGGMARETVRGWRRGCVQGIDPAGLLLLRMDRGSDPLAPDQEEPPYAGASVRLLQWGEEKPAAANLQAGGPTTLVEMPTGLMDSASAWRGVQKAGGPKREAESAIPPEGQTIR